MNNNKKGQSLIHKTENLLDETLFMITLTVHSLMREDGTSMSPHSDSDSYSHIHLRPPGKVLTVNLGQHKLETMSELYISFILAQKMCF